MRKTIASLILVTLLLGGFALAMAQAAPGVIRGQVVNGSQDQNPVPGITITLHIFDSHAAEKGSLTTTADEAGNFSFSELDTSGDLLYVAVAEFDGVAYRSPVASFSEGQTVITLPLEVYETTTSDRAIVVERAHLIIDVDLEHQVLQVSEMYFINNTGNRTFIGQGGTGGERYTLRFPLPEGAENPSARGLTIGEGEALYSVPVIPGPMAEPIVLDYILPIREADVRLAHRVAYPIKDYNILVSDVGVEVKSPGVEFRGKAGQGENVYLNYVGSNLEKDAELLVELRGLGRIRLPSRGFSPALLLIVVLAALALLGLSIAYPRLRRGDRSVPRESRREQLLQELADLDDAFEQGLIDKDEYARKRRAKKKQLLKLMQKK